MRHAPIDGEFYAGDVGAFFGGEKHDRGRNFLGLASAAEWNLRGEPDYRLFHHFGGDARFLKRRSFDWSGAYRIHADFVVS